MSKLPPLYKAVFDGDCDRIDALLAGSDVNKITEDGVQINLLSLALGVTEPPNPAVIRHLIELGVDVNEKDRRGWTPLHFAVHHRGPVADPSWVTASVKLLLDAGAEVNAEDDAGLTPLHRSVCHYPWNFEMIEALLGAGARKTVIFSRFINAVASPEKDKLVELLAKYEEQRAS